jgi:hypothetical protein
VNNVKHVGLLQSRLPNAQQIGKIMALRRPIGDSVQPEQTGPLKGVLKGQGKWERRQELIQKADEGNTEGRGTEGVGSERTEEEGFLYREDEGSRLLRNYLAWHSRRQRSS